MMRTFPAVVAMVIVLLPAGAGEDYLQVDDITMSIVGGDAFFELNYTLDYFAKLYVLALGCGYIEPDLLSLFKSYDNPITIKASPTSAAVMVKGAGKMNSGYYLFDSKPLGVEIARFTVIYPEGLRRTFHNVTSTPNVFCGN